MKTKTLKIIILYFLLFHYGINTIYSQVGIGTTNPQASLDINSTTDGLLIPRVALSATNVATVITPTISEMVYNTFTSAVGPNQVTPGYYYWNGSLWASMLTANPIKMFSGTYTPPVVSDTTTKNLLTLLQSGGWVVNLIGGGNWQQRFTIANTNTFSLSGTNSMVIPINADVNTGSSIVANRVDIIYQKDVTITPQIGFAIALTTIQQGHIEAWTNDGSSKMTLTWWGHEFNTRTMRWNITIINN
jgi:hypothetical protein